MILIASPYTHAEICLQKFVRNRQFLLFVVDIHVLSYFLCFRMKLFEREFIVSF